MNKKETNPVDTKKSNLPQNCHHVKGCKSAHPNKSPTMIDKLPHLPVAFTVLDEISDPKKTLKHCTPSDASESEPSGFGVRELLQSSEKESHSI